MKHTNEHWTVRPLRPPYDELADIVAGKVVVQHCARRPFAEYVTFLHNREYEEAVADMRARRRIVRSLIAGRKSRKSGADEGIYGWLVRMD